MESLDGALRRLDPGARVFAYLNDIVVVVRPGQAAAAHLSVQAALAGQGLALNGDKTAVWCRQAEQELPAALAAQRGM